ncbi:MAG TPA: hypothetical protein VFM54_01800 [Micromonosporaceae bacterium]|nr:hypothetical protein [Micromonosporaceae bacterium]
MLIRRRRLMRPADFDHAQIRDSLVPRFSARLTNEIDDPEMRRAEESSHADAHPARPGDMEHLLGLSSNQRMLCFIAEFDEDELLAA